MAAAKVDAADTTDTADVDGLAAAAATLTQRELACFEERTPASKTLFERALRSLPYGVASSFQRGDPYPTYLLEGHGSRVVDVDGNHYVDFHGGFGCNLTGHGHPKVAEAITRAATRGTH